MTAIRPGDATIAINGEAHKLRLTLGALADIETRLGGEDKTPLVERLKNPRISDLLIILHALLGGGGAALTIEALKASDVDLAAAASAVTQAFKVLDPFADKPDIRNMRASQSTKQTISENETGAEKPDVEKRYVEKTNVAKEVPTQKNNQPGPTNGGRRS